MHREGHAVANHSWSHPDFTMLTRDQVHQGLQSAADEYYHLTGAPMAPCFRPPMGIFSAAVLQYTKELAYYTVFWSMAFRDWDPQNQPGSEYSYRHVIGNIHPGAVILLHAVSESNTRALNQIIETLKSLGYVFALFDN